MWKQENLSYCVALVVPELLGSNTFLPSFPNSWYYRYIPPCPAIFVHFNFLIYIYFTVCMALISEKHLRPLSSLNDYSTDNCKESVFSGLYGNPCRHGSLSIKFKLSVFLVIFHLIIIVIYLQICAKIFHYFVDLFLLLVQ